MAFQVNMLIEKLTKKAIRYQEVDNKGNPVAIIDGAKIGTLYIRQTAFPGHTPRALAVTVTAPGE